MIGLGQGRNKYIFYPRHRKGGLGILLRDQALGNHQALRLSGRQPAAQHQSRAVAVSNAHMSQAAIAFNVNLAKEICGTCIDCHRMSAIWEGARDRQDTQGSRANGNGPCCRKPHVNAYPAYLGLLAFQGQPAKGLAVQ